ncbi:MAG: signal peptidase I [Clostridia bacterium]|nr:signal peptidase I [Clostridia bacterium]
MIYTNDIIKKKNARKKVIKKTIKFICSPFIIAIILIILYMGYQKFFKKDSNVSIFGFKQYMVLTGSMEPNYNIGDLIIVKEVKENELNVGDVITYSIGNGMETISHRIISITNSDGAVQYQTKGDNNNSPDTDLVSYNQVQGRLVFKISKLGLIITQLTTGTGIAIILLVVALSYVHTNRKEEKRIAREDARSRFNKPRYSKEGTL